MPPLACPYSGLAPYTYSEELPYDELLDQHTAGVLERTDERPALTVAVLRARVRVRARA